MEPLTGRETLKEAVRKLADQVFERVVQFRRHLHRYPELSMQEHATAAFITSKLAEWGIPFIAGVAGTGIVATVHGANPNSQLIALRADMDALPITEAGNVDYRSENNGVMHACGHDAHVASLLGAAYILNRLSDRFEGSVRLLFQPSEETYPGGASMMIAEGVLENPVPTAIFGQHVFPLLEAGEVGFRSGNSMASTDEIYITVNGKGGHGATPDQVTDPVLIASHLLISLQQLVSRKAPPMVPTVISFGRFIAEGRVNIIPDTANLEGTFRTYDENWRKEAHALIKQHAEKFTESMGASCNVRIEKGYPVLKNDNILTERAIQYATEYLGHQKVKQIEPRMSSEDFAWYSQIVPACFYRLGTANQHKGINANLHTAAFNIDEEALRTGTGLMAWIALCELNAASG
ncbi:MAG TPA: M20 family metallopeptidase [Bacteroidales bacterium]|nr:M20 family metallopeptidase [Bacteroidales bacterium]